ncbi:MAG: sodium:solute symporter [Planctomycetota bacterium]
MPNLFDSQLALLDWLILAGYFVLIITIGALASRGKNDEQGFFLGGRRMPAWAVAMSFAATTLSAATFIGGPAESFKTDLTLLSFEIAKVLGALLVAALFLPPLFRSGCTTVYGYLGRRVGPGAMQAASAMFLFGRLLASGARLFIAGTAFSLILYGNLETANLVLAIVLFGVVGTLYTTLGGIKAVIWTDTLQLLVVVGAVVVAMLLLLHAIPLPMSEIVHVLQQEQKTRLLDTSSDLSKATTLWAGLAMTFFFAAAFGADQDMAQRLLTCKSLKQSVGALLGATLIALPITVMFMATGLLLYIFYTQPGLMGAAAPADAVTDHRQAYPRFLLNELPIGIRGVAIAGLFAAAMSSLDSAMNAMASSAVSDLINPARRALSRSEESDELAPLWSRLAVVLMGALLTAAALVMALIYDPEADTLIRFALGVMTFAYAGLMGVFLCVLLTGRGSTASVIAALITGMAVIAASRYVPLIKSWPIAWPYWMVIGTAASLGVCLIGAVRRDHPPYTNRSATRL